MKSSLARHLKKILGQDGFSTDPWDLRAYSYDASGLTFTPTAIALPRTIEQVASILRLAEQEGLKIYPRGAGTGTTGACLAEQPGLVLCLTRMDKILSISPENLCVTVEPGVITGRIQNYVEARGLFYPPDPASLAFCTIGGNVATCAGGARAVKYGVTRDYVMGLELVLAGGKVITTGVKTAKGVVGYDLTRLIVGSEGSLGVITRITLRLIPAPRCVGTLLSFFSSVNKAARAVVSLFSQGIVPRCAEFLDALSIKCIKEHLPDGVPAGTMALLLVEVDGNRASVKEQLSDILTCFEKEQAILVKVAKGPEEAKRFWSARRALSPAIRRLGFPDKVSEDICVPRNRLPEILERIGAIGNDTGITILCFGHAGDGNLHVNLLLDLKEPGAFSRCEKAVRRIMEDTVSVGGTISGEHGIGITKRPYITLELKQQVIQVMKQIKSCFDPKGILNPGKVFP